MSNSESSSGLILFVASDGDDNWSGRMAMPNKAKNDGPFATLEKARDEIRKLRQSGQMPPGGITVEIRGGVYYLDKPFELGEADSGNENSPVVYRSRTAKK